MDLSKNVTVVPKRASIFLTKNFGKSKLFFLDMVMRELLMLCLLKKLNIVELFQYRYIGLSEKAEQMARYLESWNTVKDRDRDGKRKYS